MDRRSRFREGLNPLYSSIYDNLCAILPPRWQPYCGFRSFAEQKKLYDQGRIGSGRKVTDAGPGTSPHNYGCASDWTLFDINGKPIWLESHDSAWQEYADACKSAGAKWGIKISAGIDSPHNELPIKCKWSDVYDQYLLYGTAKAMEHVAANSTGLSE